MERFKTSLGVFSESDTESSHRYFGEVLKRYLAAKNDRLAIEFWNALRYDLVRRPISRRPKPSNKVTEAVTRSNNIREDEFDQFMKNAEELAEDDEVDDHIDDVLADNVSSDSDDLL